MFVFMYSIMAPPEITTYVCITAPPEITLYVCIHV